MCSSIPDGVGITSGKIELVRICLKKNSYQWDEKIIPLVRIFFFYKFSPVGRIKFSPVGKEKRKEKRKEKKEKKRERKKKKRERAGYAVF